VTYLTVDEAAEKLHMTVDTVRRFAATDRIPARKVGRRWLFHPELLDKYMRGEWRSTNEVPAGLGGLDSQLAVRLFVEAADQRIESSPSNTKRRSARVISGKKN